MLANPQSAPLSPPLDIGRELYDLAAEIFPICRSITGSGVGETLEILSRHINIERHDVPTGTPVFDWTIPKEWVIRDAYVRAPSGAKVIDFAASNLHVLNYSTPMHRTMSLTELRPHIFTLPDQPDLIPYRTSYYKEHWGFCMAHNSLLALPEGQYDVHIDAELRDGNLTYGEYLHRGETDREFVLYAHICHPSLANDNCSGLALLTLLARSLLGRRTRYCYRFIFAPGTIGSLTWLSANRERLDKIDHGLCVSCAGDAGAPSYKRSRRGDTMIDRAMSHILTRSGHETRVSDFSPYGYDERQFCSPGFNLPFGLFQRSPFGTFPQYHTCADNLDFITPEHLAASYDLISQAMALIEANWTPRNLSPFGEPQLGRRGLYASMGGEKTTGQNAMAYLWVLNLSDGEHSLLDIAERSGLPFAEIAQAAARLRDADLLADAGV